MGELATQQLAEIYKKNIMDNWGQETKYKYGDTEYDVIWDVNVSVMQYDQPKIRDGKSNYLTVIEEVQSKVYDSWYGFIRCKSTDQNIPFELDNPMSHEFGHMLGLIDRYDTKTNKAHNGWSGNIMEAQAGSGVVDRRNMSAMFDIPLSHYHKSENQVKAINGAFFNWFGQWNYIWRINSQNRER